MWWWSWSSGASKTTYFTKLIITRHPIMYNNYEKIIYANLFIIKENKLLFQYSNFKHKFNVITQKLSSIDTAFICFYNSPHTLSSSSTNISTISAWIPLHGADVRHWKRWNTKCYIISIFKLDKIMIVCIKVEEVGCFQIEDGQWCANFIIF